VPKGPCKDIIQSDQKNVSDCLQLVPTSWAADGVIATLSKPNYLARKSLGDDNQFLGFYLARSITDFVELLFICVAPAFRMQGIGRHLLQDCLAESKQLGAKSVELEVRESNSRAIELYTANGFFEVGRREGYYRAETIGGQTMAAESAVLLSVALS